MNKKWNLLLALALWGLIISLDVSVGVAQGPGDGPVATVNVSSTEITWQPQVSYAGLLLTISGPDSLYFREKFGAGHVTSFEAAKHPDGSYTYELRATPVLEAEVLKALAAIKEADNREAMLEQLRQAGKLPEPLVQSGYFSIDGGVIVMGGDSEEETDKDIVHSDDVIIDGGYHLCVGSGCTNGEVFSYDNIKLNTDNLRVGFEDTSVGNFPTRDWQIEVNSSVSGEADYFMIRDCGDAGTTAADCGGSNTFTLEAEAPNNSLYVDNNGLVGLGTSTPVYELHIVDGDSPAIRLEQDDSYGWDAQRWDVVANESQFFIRDATNGSKLPFRIQPDSPSNSLTVRNTGYVGIGTWSPEDKLHVTGNVLVDGNVTENSDVNAKENFTPVEGQEILTRLAEVPITTWNFKADDSTVRHMGPMAQDFYAAFELGPDERHIAPLDTNGVALTSIQALYRMVQDKEAQIEQLQQQNTELEERIEALERLVETLAQQ